MTENSAVTEKKKLWKFGSLLIEWSRSLIATWNDADWHCIVRKRSKQLAEKINEAETFPKEDKDFDNYK